jgi:pyruvate dehydrogenase E2 component (dihydrolipoamide acetyltransferase)
MSVPEAVPGRDDWGDVERRPLSEIRRASSEQVSRSWTATPHGWQYAEADISELQALRQRYNEGRGEAGPTVGIAAFAIKAAVAALKEQPRLNASLDGASQELILKRYYHIGVTVDTVDGRLAPAIRGADRKSVVEVAEELTAMEERARQGDLEPKACAGTTFTVARLGSREGPTPTPLVNGPEVALLGVGELKEVSMASGWSAPLMLPVCLAYDRRAISEAEAERFLNDVVRYLSEPMELLLR